MKKDICYIIVIIVLFCISISALIFSLSDINCSFLEYSNDSFKDILGVLVSSLAIVVTAFLVIMDVSAANRYREINNNAESVNSTLSQIEASNSNIQNIQQECNRILTSIQTSSDMAKTTMQNFAQILPEMYEGAIAIADKSAQIDLRDNLKKMLARLSYNYPYLSEDDRYLLMMDLSAIGDESDIPYLENISKSDKESEQIKYIANKILDQLRQKYL